MLNRRIWAAAWMIGVAWCGYAGSAPPPVRWQVVELGGLADGATDATAAFQKALDAAGKAGGGVVEVPGGTVSASAARCRFPRG